MDVAYRRLAHALTGRYVHPASRGLLTSGDNKPAYVTATVLRLNDEFSEPISNAS